jgi:hypothetical protein
MPAVLPASFGCTSGTPNPRPEHNDRARTLAASGPGNEHMHTGNVVALSTTGNNRPWTWPEDPAVAVSLLPTASAWVRRAWRRANLMTRST